MLNFLGCDASSCRTFFSSTLRLTVPPDGWIAGQTHSFSDPNYEIPHTPADATQRDCNLAAIFRLPPTFVVYGPPDQFDRMIQRL